MKFGDRLNGASIGQWQRQNQKYLKHLHSQGISRAHPLYPYFAAEVFHDSELAIGHLDMKNSELRLQLKNVYAIDAVCDFMIKNNCSGRNEVHDADFYTSITFRGLTHFSLDCANQGGALHYQCGELRRHRNALGLEILSMDARRKPGSIKIVFFDAEIEDISPRLKKYVGREARSFISPFHFPTVA